MQSRCCWKGLEAAEKHSLMGWGLDWFWSRYERTSVQGGLEPEQRQVGWRNDRAVEAAGHTRGWSRWFLLLTIKTLSERQELIPLIT